MRGLSRRALARLGAMGATAALVTGPAGAASASVQTVDGGAYGVYDYVSIPSQRVGPLPQVTLPATGSAAPITKSAASARGNALDTGALSVSTQGTTGTTGSSTSTAQVTGVQAVAGNNIRVAMSVISSTCKSDSHGSTGSVQITDGSAGSTTLPANPGPNTVVPLAGGYNVTLNKQTASNSTGSTSITVDAAVIDTAAGYIILGQSQCSAAGPDVQVPVGAAGGVLLAGTVGVGFLGYQWRRRRHAHTVA